MSGQRWPMRSMATTTRVSATGQAAVEKVPALAILGTGGAGDADVAVDVELGHAGSPELQLLGGGVHPLRGVGILDFR